MRRSSRLGCVVAGPTQCKQSAARSSQSTAAPPPSPPPASRKRARPPTAPATVVKKGTGTVDPLGTQLVALRDSGHDVATRAGWWLSDGLDHCAMAGGGQLAGLMAAHPFPAFYANAGPPAATGCMIGGGVEPGSGITFAALCKAVVGQQLAGAAARAIWVRHAHHPPIASRIRTPTGQAVSSTVVRTGALRRRARRGAERGAGRAARPGGGRRVRAAAGGGRALRRQGPGAGLTL